LDVKELLTGVGLFTFGVGSYVNMRRSVYDDRRALRIARARWWIDRGSARRAGLSQEEWFEDYVRFQRKAFKWVFGPFVLLWTSLTLVLVVRGLIG